MNNDKVKDFIKGVGALVEMWTVIYRQFIDHGYSQKDALVHTEAFMRATITTQSGMNTKDEEDK